MRRPSVHSSTVVSRTKKVRRCGSRGGGRHTQSQTTSSNRISGAGDGASTIGRRGARPNRPQRVGCFPNPISDSARHPSPGKRLQSDAQLAGKACETRQTCISGSEHPSVEIREYERNQHPSPSRGQATPFPNGRVPSSPYLAVSQARGWPRPGRRISTNLEGPGNGHGRTWDCDHAPVYKGAAVSRIPGFVPACSHLTSPTTAPDVSCACRGLFLAPRLIRSPDHLSSHPSHLTSPPALPFHLVVVTPPQQKTPKSHIINNITKPRRGHRQNMADHVMELVIRAGAAVVNGTNAPPQAGILEGANPSKYTPSNPITLFIIQVR